MATTEIAGGTLGSVNVGLAAAVGFINPLGAQLDAFLGLTLGPLQAEISAQLNANLAVQASLGLSIGDPLVALRAALAAVAQLQAAIEASIAFPININANAQLSATAALAGALSAKLGLLDAAVKALLAIKIPALEAAATLGATLSAGPIVLMEFSGGTLAAHGTAISAAFNAGVGSTVLPPLDVINPGDLSFGYILVTKNPIAFGALTAVLT